MSQVLVQDQPEPLINPEDENFLGRVISAEGTPPPLPDRPAWITNPVVGDSKANNSQMVILDRPEVALDRPIVVLDRPTVVDDLEAGKFSDTSLAKKSDGQIQKSNHKRRRRSSGKGKGKANEDEDEKEKSGGIFSFLRRKNKDGLERTKNVSDSESESENEVEDISKVLNDLEISSSNNKTFSLSAESQKLVKQFTVVLKDLINGVPTAYDDLISLLNDSQGTLAKTYDHLPPFMKKMVATMPDKLKSTLAPGFAAVATEAQANFHGEGTEKGSATMDSSGGLKGAAQGLIGSIGLKELVTKPGSVVKLLKSIMNALKLRWPAFIGTNVLLSLSLFILLFIFWYCHKRGRETRLEREGKPIVVDSEGRIVELPDDAMLPSASGTTGNVNHPVLPGPAETALVARESNNEIVGGMSGPSSRRREKDRRSSSGSGSSGDGERRRRRRRRDRESQGRRRRSERERRRVEDLGSWVDG